MTNTTLLHYLIARYCEKAFTDNYIIGFELGGVIYASFVDDNMLPFITCLDKASRGQGMSLRFRPTKAQKQLLCTTAQVVCSKEYFEDMVNSSKYNKGEIFEKLVTEEIFGQTWTKDNIPFTISGDVVVDEKHYQVKYQGATFTNEKTLASLK